MRRRLNGGKRHDRPVAGLAGRRDVHPLQRCGDGYSGLGLGQRRSRQRHGLRVGSKRRAHERAVRVLARDAIRIRSTGVSSDGKLASGPASVGPAWLGLTRAIAAFPMKAGAYALTVLFRLGFFGGNSWFNERFLPLSG